MFTRSLFYALCCLAAFSHAGYAAGTVAAPFLKLTAGARNVAMGEGGVTAGDTASASGGSANPAGLYSVQKRSLSLMHASWLEGITYQSASYAHAVRGGVLGVSLTYLSMPAIEKYNNNGVKMNESFQSSDMVAGVSWAVPVGEVPFGITGKYIASVIDDARATGIAFDVGIMIDPVFFPEKRTLRAGVVLQNIGTPMKFSKESYPLPSCVKAGVSIFPVRPWEIALEADKYLDEDVVGRAGTEYLIALGGDAFIAVRAGYRTMRGFEENAGITAGAGFGYQGFSFDYAFVPYGELTDTHRVSVTFGF